MLPTEDLAEFRIALFFVLRYFTFYVLFNKKYCFVSFRCCSSRGVNFPVSLISFMFTIMGVVFCVVRYSRVLFYALQCFTWYIRFFLYLCLIINIYLRWPSSNVRLLFRIYIITFWCDDTEFFIRILYILISTQAWEA